MRFSLQRFFLGLFLFFILVGGIFIFVAAQVFQHNLAAQAPQGLPQEFIKKATISVAIQEGFIIMAMLFFIGGSLFFVIQIFIIKPLRQLYVSMKEVSEKNFSVKLPSGPKNEIGDLFIVFNKMIDDLKRSREALEEANIILEIKVQARTKELKGLAGSLDNQVKEKTKELEVKISELERFNKLAVGRELRMIELKNEIEKLMKKNG